MFFAFAGMATLGYCQDVNVSINNQEASTKKEDCAFKINGICSTEDIGGVDVEIQYSDGTTWMVFTNYNDFSVSVLYMIKNEMTVTRIDYVPTKSGACDCSGVKNTCFHTNFGTTGNIVLGKDGVKKIKIDKSFQYKRLSNGDWAYCEMDQSDYYSLSGIIVRKLKKWFALYVCGRKKGDIIIFVQIDYPKWEAMLPPLLL